MCPIESFPVNIWKSMIDIHLTAPFLLVRYFLPFMKQKGKTIEPMHEKTSKLGFRQGIT